jgi:hypothetical protein
LVHKGQQAPKEVQDQLVHKVHKVQQVHKVRKVPKELVEE